MRRSYLLFLALLATNTTLLAQADYEDPRHCNTTTVSISDACMVVLNSWEEIDKDLHEIFYTSGNVVDNTAIYDLILADYTNAIQQHPTLARLYYYRANVYYQKGDFTYAIADYNKAIHLNPNFFEAFNNRGAVYDEQHLYDRAIVDYNTAIRLKHDDLIAYDNRGTAYDHEGNFHHAVADYDAGLKLRHVKMTHTPGNRLIAERQLQFYNQALATADDPVTFEAAGLMTVGLRCQDRAILRRFTAALSDCNQLIKYDGKYDFGYFSRGFVYLKMKKPDLAIADFNTAISINPKIGYYYFCRGLAERLNGNKSAADADFTAADSADAAFNASAEASNRPPTHLNREYWILQLQ